MIVDANRSNISYVYGGMLQGCIVHKPMRCGKSADILRNSQEIAPENHLIDAQTFKSTFMARTRKVLCVHRWFHHHTRFKSSNRGHGR
jgi:hypothetical protein